MASKNGRLIPVIRNWNRSQNQNRLPKQELEPVPKPEPEPVPKPELAKRSIKVRLRPVNDRFSRSLTGRSRSLIDFDGYNKPVLTGFLAGR